jgi:hypothetical protein
VDATKIIGSRLGSSNACPLLFAHGRHAKIARRVTLSQAFALVPSGTSNLRLTPSRPLERGVSRSSRNVGRGCGGRGGAVDEWR